MINLRACLAEGIATFALVFFGTISITLAAAIFGSGLTIEGIIMISLAHGAVIGLMVYTFGHVSGAHINPAVTIPMIILKKIDLRNGIGYIVAQLIGGVIGAFAHVAFIPQGAQVHFGTQTGPSELLGSNVFAGLGVEIILTFFLVSVIFMTVIHRKALAGIAGLSIGGMVFLIHLIGEFAEWP